MSDSESEQSHEQHSKDQDGFATPARITEPVAETVLQAPSRHVPRLQFQQYLLENKTN